MTQKILQVGTSAAITLPKQVMQKLGLHVGDRVTTRLHEKTGAFSIRPAKQVSGPDQRIARLTARFIERHRKDLEALAHK